MSETCFYQNCDLLTDKYCVNCKRPLCNSCEKFFLCVDCKVPHTVNRNNNRQSLTRNRKVTPDVTSGDTNNTPDELLSQSLPDPQELRLSSLRKRKKPTGEDCGDTNHPQDVQEMLSQSLPDPQVLQVQRKQRVNCAECNNCHAKVTYLRNHLHEKDACATYYREQFEMDDVDDIADKVIRDNRNMNRAKKRKEDVANGNAREQRRDKSFVDCWKDHVETTMHTLLVIPCVFCESKFNIGKGIEKLPDDDIQLGILLDEYPERRDMHKFENSLWKCKTCECMSKRLNGNHTLLDCLKDLFDVDENDHAETVLIMSYEEFGQLSTVFLPKLQGAPDELVFSDAAISENQCTAMIPDGLCRLSAEVSIEPEVAEFLVNRHEIDTCILSSGLYTDIDKKMKGAGIQIECSHETTKVGLVENNVLNLEENKNAHEYYLNKIRCTEAFQKKLIMENLAKQNFNGKQNLDVDVPIPGLPAGLATFLLSEMNVPVVVELFTNEKGLADAHQIVPCQLDESRFCDIRNCDRAHKSAVQRIEEIFKDGLPETISALVCRYLQGFVQSLETNLFSKLTEHHHLQLQFHLDGTVNLVGNVWIKELVPYNRTGEMLGDKSVIPKHFTDDLHLKLVQEKRELYNREDCDKVTEETSRHLEMDDWKKVREASLKELIWVSGRGFKSVWTDQTVVKLSVSNPTYMKQLFRRKRQEGDENEEIYYDEQRREWVLIATMRVKFVQKPGPMKHVTLGQFGGYYKKPDPRSPIDFDRLRQELTENNGVLGQSDICVHTNMNKYPNELKYLPQWVLLRNGSIMKLRKTKAVIAPTGRLDHFGMRILCEPFENEQELIDEQANNADLPDLETLEHRLKEMYPTSSFEVNI